MNFTDVGGKLYFTANVGVAGTQLWKSDGTAAGTVKVADIPGFAANLTAIAGSSVLNAALAGPANGIPAVDYSFSVGAAARRRQPRHRGGHAGPRRYLHTQSLADLLEDLQSAFPGGDVAVALVEGRFAFIALDTDIVRIRVLGAEALGFGANQASPQAVSLTGGPVSEPDVGAVSFNLDVQVIGGQVLSVEVALTAEVTADNETAAQLAADINAILPSALLSRGFSSSAVTVSADASGALVLSVVDPTSPPSPCWPAPAAWRALGFTAGQISTRSVALAAAQVGPANGKCPPI